MVAVVAVAVVIMMVVVMMIMMILMMKNGLPLLFVKWEKPCLVLLSPLLRYLLWRSPETTASCACTCLCARTPPWAHHVHPPHTWCCVDHWRFSTITPP